MARAQCGLRPVRMTWSNESCGTSVCLWRTRAGPRRHQLAEQFGGGYEIEYLNDVLFLFAEALFDSAGNYLRCQLIPIQYTLRHVGDYVCPQKVAALVEYPLLDDLVSSQQH
jgi:hypothetical protein